MDSHWSQQQLAAIIDHTILKSETTDNMVAKICDEARLYSFAAVCVNPVHVNKVSRLLKRTSVKTCTVVGFPLGSNTTWIKIEEARLAVKQGAQEIDMVMNVGALKSGDIKLVKADIAGVVEAAGDAVVKVIIETCYLTDDEIRSACHAIMDAKAHFVKTSTGFGPAGAKASHIRLIREIVGDTLRIKASGGIGSIQDAERMVAAGADRLGTSSGVKIVSGATT